MTTRKAGRKIAARPLFADRYPNMDAELGWCK
jgi:hypothetical protein